MVGKCTLCLQDTFFDDSTCKYCGYNFEIKKINNKDACRKHYQKIDNGRTDWVNPVEFMLRLQNLTSYENIEIGKLLGISRSKVCQDIKLAQAFTDHPELKNNISKTNARSMLNDVIPKNLFENEEKLHINLYKKWNKTPFAKEWNLVKTGSPMGKYRTDEIGEMDLLAHNKNKNKWLVIELKQRQSSDKTVGQILRYMGWIKKNKARENDTIEGLIICGEYNREMEYALECTPGINAKIYKFQNNTFDFLPFDKNSRTVEFLNSLGPEIRKRVLENFMK